MRKMIKRIAIALASLTVLLIVAWFFLFWRESPRGQLPWSASNVRVSSSCYGVQGWDYAMRADLPEKDFPTYVDRLGMRLATTNYYQYIKWRSGGSNSWWNPSPSLDSTYIRHNGMGLDRLKYEDGTIYYKSTGS